MNCGPISIVPSQGCVERELRSLAAIYAKESDGRQTTQDHVDAKLKAIRGLRETLCIEECIAESEACRRCDGTGMLIMGHANDPASHQPCPECADRSERLQRLLTELD
jgi:hypothetical protein